MDCPRCQTQLKAITLPELDDAKVYLCPNCEGGWYPQPSLEDLTLESNRAAVEKTELAPTLVADQLEKIDLDAPVSCPECGQEMKRYSYPLAPDTALDRCEEHGAWLDDGELGVMLEQIEANQKLLEQTRKGVAEAREEMDIGGIAKGSRFNPIGMTLRVLNAVFGSTKPDRNIGSPEK